MNNYDDLLNNASENTSAEQNGQLSKEDYATKKQAERESLYTLSDIAALSVAGDGNKFQQFLDVQAKFSRYSAVNALLIYSQKPDATRLGGFELWKSNGGFIRSGQTGISILEPGKEYDREDGSTGVSYNVKKVFDASQVDTRKVRAIPQPQYDERQLLKALISNATARITGVDELPGDFGAMTDPETGEICVRKGMAFADTFRSTAQELAAAELAKSYDTQTEPAFSAYCASYLVCEKHGVDTHDFDFSLTPATFDGMDAQEIKGELSQIRDAADNISGRMARALGAVDKPAINKEAR